MNKIKDTIFKNKKNKIMFFSMLFLLLVVMIAVIYDNRIGIKYYWNKMLGRQGHIKDQSVIKEEVKELSASFKNWYIEVDLDDINNPYKNVDLNNVIVSGGVGKYTINYELVYTPSSKMVYTIIDEAKNKISLSQKVTYVVSRENRNKAMEVFYNIAKKYGYISYEKYTSGEFHKNINNMKYHFYIRLFNTSLSVDDITNGNGFCNYTFLTQRYYCMLDNSDIDYNNYVDIHTPMEQMISEYNQIMEKYNAAGYNYKYFIAKPKD
jgi:hypothetical protein